MKPSIVPLHPSVAPAVAPVPGILEAWQRLARAGAACRYAGRATDGRHESLLLQPATGTLLASGRGDSVAESICAALNAIEAARPTPGASST